MAKVQVFNTTGVDGERLGQYMGIRRKVTRTVKGQTYTMAIYGAYNALGLIGSEYNGIVVVNETKKCVVTDNVEKTDSGWFGATARQVETFDKLAKLRGDAFIKAIKATANFRGVETVS